MSGPLRGGTQFIIVVEPGDYLGIIDISKDAFVFQSVICASLKGNFTSILQATCLSTNSHLLYTIDRNCLVDPNEQIYKV